MPEQITDFRVDTVEMRESDFYNLPPQTRKLIQAYAEPEVSGRNGILRFKLPITRWKEINESLRALTSSASGAAGKGEENG